MKKIFQGAEVKVLREAKDGDIDWNPDGDVQDLVEWDNGDKRAVLRSELFDVPKK